MHVRSVRDRTGWELWSLALSHVAKATGSLMHALGKVWRVQSGRVAANTAGGGSVARVTAGRACTTSAVGVCAVHPMREGGPTERRDGDLLIDFLLVEIYW